MRLKTKEWRGWCQLRVKTNKPWRIVERLGASGTPDSMDIMLSILLETLYFLERLALIVLLSFAKQAVTRQTSGLSYQILNYMVLATRSSNSFACHMNNFAKIWRILGPFPWFSTQTIVISRHILLSGLHNFHNHLQHPFLSPQPDNKSPHDITAKWDVPHISHTILAPPHRRYTTWQTSQASKLVIAQSSVVVINNSDVSSHKPATPTPCHLHQISLEVANLQQTPQHSWRDFLIYIHALYEEICVASPFLTWLPSSCC